MKQLSLVLMVFFLPLSKLSFSSLAVSCISTHENFTDRNYINALERLLCSSTEQGGSIATPQSTSWMNDYNRKQKVINSSQASEEC